MQQVTLTANGKRHAVEVKNRMLLVELLREKLGLTGTHVGCDTNRCGAVLAAPRSSPGAGYRTLRAACGGGLRPHP